MLVKITNKFQLKNSVIKKFGEVTFDQNNVCFQNSNRMSKIDAHECVEVREPTKGWCEQRKVSEGPIEC